MLKRNYTPKVLWLFCFYCIICIAIYNQRLPQSNMTNKVINNVVISHKKDLYALLDIPKLNSKYELFAMNDSRNNVDNNVTILPISKMPDEKHSLLILAAHSGSGQNAYFNNIDKLNITDEIIIYYHDHRYIYEITNKSEENKTGIIHIKKENDKNQIILTTCSTKDLSKQLVINGLLKDVE